MLVDGSQVPAGTHLRRDAVVVGSGPAGITVAQELARRGLDVVVVEAGGRTHTRRDERDLRGASSGDPFPLVRSRRRAFGGTSSHWEPGTGFRMRPLDELDFTARHGRPDASWPFSCSDLTRHYARAHELVGMQHDYRPARWGLDSFPSPLVWSGGPELAMFQFAPHRCFVDRWDELVEAPAITLLLRTAVRSIDLDAGGQRVRAMSVRSADGADFTVEGTVYVVAAGGIENARILLSSPGRNGNGVGNEHDNVGRWFMDHLSVDSGIVVGLGGHDLGIGAFEERRVGGDDRQAMLWLGPEIIQREGLLNASSWIDAEDPLYLSKGVGAARSARNAWHTTPRRDLGRALAGTARHLPDLVRYGLHTATGGPRRPTIASMRTISEQLPDRRSRVRLGDGVDSYGNRTVDVAWRCAESDLALVRQHQDVLARLWEGRGVATIIDRFDPAEHPSPVMLNYHHIGSTRMHVDPRHGVVDADSLVHGTTNLYVTGSSVFPTGGYLNPTITIIALAARLAETMADRLAPSRVSVGSAPG